MANKQIRIGAGAGFSDDRMEPALELTQSGELDYLVFECLAERTIARESLTRSKNPALGYTPTLPERMQLVLPECLRRGIRIVTNMGAANPMGAAKLVREMAQSFDGPVPRIAAVTGDDVTEVIRANPQLILQGSGEPVESLIPRLECANAYLGADVVHEALKQGAAVVLTGRVSDPSLFLGCMLHGLGWSYDDYARLAMGTFAGHLLECAAQLTGGCFADPPRKFVPDMARIGFPFVDVSADGGIVLGKVDGSGGRLDVATCTEQALYEIHDPSSYITPDCILDITQAEFRQLGKDRVEMLGATARPRTDSYKVVVGYDAGWIGEGQVGYAGPHALARARLAEQIVRERLAMRGFTYDDFRVDYIGVSSLHGDKPGRSEPYEVRLRVAARSGDRKAAEAVGFEVRTLNVNGPAGGGGGTHSTREVIGVDTLLLPRQHVHPRVSVEGGQA